MLAGLLLLAFAFAGVGCYVKCVPWPVVSGFTHGIAAIIALQQLPGLLGLAAGGSGHGEGILVASVNVLRRFLAVPTWGAPALGLLATAIMAGWSSVRRLKPVPGGIVALVAVTLVSLLAGFDGVPRIGAIPAALPMPARPPLPAVDLTVLVRAALAISVLAALESLLSAVVADGMTVRLRAGPDDGRDDRVRPDPGDRGGPGGRRGAVHRAREPQVSVDPARLLGEPDAPREAAIDRARAMVAEVG